MNYRYSLVILFFLVSMISEASNTDSLVRLREITFTSEFERTSFENFFQKKQKDAILSLFLSTDVSCTNESLKTIEGRIEKLFTQLEKDDISTKTEAKKIKAIYNSVHESFLKKYELENNFNEIFKTGNYNCVSATALYAIFLERYKIPYSIKKKPNHVFLIAYPESYKILIETTDPVKGYFQFNDAFIEKYLSDLRKAKLISEEELAKSSKAELFNKHFFSDEEVNLSELVGLHYYNHGLFQNEKENYKEAFQDLQKAYLFYPSEGIRYLLKNMLFVLLSKSSYEREEDLKYFIYLTRFHKNEEDELITQAIMGEFSRITERQLESKSNFDQYSKSYNAIKKELTDSSLRAEIDFVYNYEVARAVISSDKEQDIDQNLRMVFALKPENLYVQSMINTYVLNKLVGVNNPQTILNTLDSYSKNYKFLSDNSKISTLYTMCYLEFAYQGFAKNDLKKGEKYLNSFENFIKGKDKSILNEFFIEKCYAEAGVAYYRVGNTSKAKNILKKGLEYAPENFNLKQRLSSLH